MCRAEIWKPVFKCFAFHAWKGLGCLELKTIVVVLSS